MPEDGTATLKDCWKIAVWKSRGAEKGGELRGGYWLGPAAHGQATSKQGSAPHHPEFLFSFWPQTVSKSC